MVNGTVRIKMNRKQTKIKPLLLQQKTIFTHSYSYPVVLIYKLLNNFIFYQRIQKI